MNSLFLGLHPVIANCQSLVSLPALRREWCQETKRENRAKPTVLSFSCHVIVKGGGHIAVDLFWNLHNSRGDWSLCDEINEVWSGIRQVWLDIRVWKRLRQEIAERNKTSVQQLYPRGRSFTFLIFLRKCTVYATPRALAKCALNLQVMPGFSSGAFALTLISVSSKSGRFLRFVSSDPICTCIPTTPECPSYSFLWIWLGFLFIYMRILFLPHLKLLIKLK